jgi:hypothetical protein
VAESQRRVAFGVAPGFDNEHEHENEHDSKIKDDDEGRGRLARMSCEAFGVRPWTGPMFADRTDPGPPKSRAMGPVPSSYRSHAR